MSFVPTPMDRFVATLREGERRDYDRPLSLAANARIRARLRAALAPHGGLLRLAQIAVAIAALFVSMGVLGHRGHSSAGGPPAASVDGGPSALDGAFTRVSTGGGEPDLQQGGPRELP